MERAREVLNETTMRVLKKANALDMTRPCVPWIMGFAERIILEIYGREQKRRSRHDQETRLAEEPDRRDENAFRQVENHVDVRSYLSNLDPRERSDLEWYYELALPAESTNPGDGRSDAARSKAALRTKNRLRRELNGNDN